MRRGQSHGSHCGRHDEVFGSIQIPVTRKESIGWERGITGELPDAGGEGEDKKREIQGEKYQVRCSRGTRRGISELWRLPPKYLILEWSTYHFPETLCVWRYSTSFVSFFVRTVYVYSLQLTVHSTMDIWISLITSQSHPLSNTAPRALISTGAVSNTNLPDPSEKRKHGTVSVCSLVHGANLPTH